jgi:tyrosyl-tRNA synthetase
VPDDIAEFSLTANPDDNGVPIAQALKFSGLASSTSEALRAIQQGGVRLDGEKVSDKRLILVEGNDVTLQFGKRKFAKIKVI